MVQATHPSSDNKEDSGDYYGMKWSMGGIRRTTRSGNVPVNVARYVGSKHSMGLYIFPNDVGHPEDGAGMGRVRKHVAEP